MRYCAFVLLLLTTHSIILTMGGKREKQKTVAKIAERKLNAQKVAIQNLLIAAVTLNRTDLVISALAQGADPSVCAEGDYSPLTMAVSHNNVPMVSSLLICKADVNAYDKRENAQTPLQMAAIFAGTSMTETLLQQGALPNFHNEGDFSPLAYAIFKLKEDVAQCLVNSGADVQVATKQRGDGITNAEKRLLHQVMLQRNKAVKEHKSTK